MLHLIVQSPFHSDSLSSCLRCMDKKDVILLLQDAVVAAILEIEELYEYTQRLQVFALKPDLEARGLLAKVSQEIVLIDYEGFVDLTIHHFPIHSWA